jgi:hypothetical protein
MQELGPVTLTPPEIVPVRELLRFEVLRLVLREPRFDVTSPPADGVRAEPNRLRKVRALACPAPDRGPRHANQTRHMHSADDFRRRVVPESAGFSPHETQCNPDRVACQG